MTRDELKIRTQQAIDYIPTLMERDDGWSEIESILYEILTELDDEDNNWHTGTPTEDGWYLCWVSFTKEIAPMVYKWKNDKFMLTDTWESDDDILMWQKIEPYKED